ncbi:MAG: Na+/H+ antiporter NhaC family protein [Clostridia bacterium]|nr:Na+/H+ antiporter NhaC family protein [Clostridia bacterium]
MDGVIYTVVPGDAGATPVFDLGGTKCILCEDPGDDTALATFELDGKTVAVCPYPEPEDEDESEAPEPTAVLTASGAGIVIFSEDAPSDSRVFGTALSLLPPLIAIVLALITKEVYSSLFVGIIAGALLATNFSFSGTLDTIINDGIISAVAGNAGIFIFLVILGALVALLNRTGASAAFGRWAQKNIKTRVGAQIATFILGVLIFIDDYFNCLTVGSVMQPVTDTHKISRAKLAYLIDATAAPVCMIAPISSWAAAVSSYAKGTGYSGIALFVRAIPYNFYSLLTFVFIISLVLMKFDYGPMAKHERNALLNGDLFTSGTEHAAQDTGKQGTKGKVIDLVLPIVALILFCVIGLIYVGGFFGAAGEGNTGSFIAAFADTDATVGLPWGGIITFIVVVIYLLIRRTITFKDALECIPEGFKAMVPAITILTFAGSLKNMTSLLGSSEFVENFMKGASAGLNAMLPAVIFLVAVFISFATGTSWGTFGILIPIVVTIFPATSELMYIGMSACLAGAVCGDHCSPISDTTIMSSAGARCDHVNHVSTQLPYALTVAGVSFVSFLIAGAVSILVPGQSWFISLPVAIVLMIGTMFVIRSMNAKKAK